MIRRVLAVVAVAIAALTAVPSAATAVPRPAPEPATVVAQGTGVTAAVEPTMYPPAEKVRYLANGVNGHRCERGTLCVDAWDPTRSTYKVFILRKCVTRTLHNFHNTGLPQFVNHQTPGTVTRFLGRDGREQVTSTAPSHTTPIDWGPVWYLDVC